MKSIVCTLATLSTLATATACTAVVDEAVTEPRPQPAAPAETQDLGTSEAPRIEPQRIQGAMRRQFFSEAQGCYEALLTRDARAGGKLVLSFAIIEGGAERIGMEAEGNLSDETFQTCMRDSLALVTFPVVDGEVTVTYPVVLSDD